MASNEVNLSASVTESVSDLCASDEDSFLDLTKTPDYVYRCTLFNVSQRLNKDNLKAIMFIHKKWFPERKVSSGVKVLEKLEEVSLFSQLNIWPLQDLLEKIGRCDIVYEFWPHNEESSQSIPQPTPRDNTDCDFELEQSIGQEQSYDPHRSLPTLGSILNPGADQFLNQTTAKRLVNESGRTLTGFEPSSESIHEPGPLVDTTDKLITTKNSPTMADAAKLMEGSSKTKADDYSDSTIQAHSTTPDTASDTGSMRSTSVEAEMQMTEPKPTCIQCKLNRSKMGMCIIDHCKEKCTTHQTWHINFPKSHSRIELRLELYPYGLLEDEGNFATLKVTAKPIEMGSLLPLFVYSVKFYIFVKVGNEDPEELIRMSPIIEITSEKAYSLYLPLLAHNEHIVKRKEKYFELSVSAEYTYQQRPETVLNDLAITEREKGFTELALPKQTCSRSI